MEGLLTQVGSTSQSPDAANPSSSQSSIPLPLDPHPGVQSSNSHPHPSDSDAYLVDPEVLPEPIEPDHFGQLAMDHNGHLRWIGSSSAMTLVDAFRNITNRAARLAPRADGTPSRSFRPEAKTAAQNLYFPPTLRFDTRALPGPEQAEFPPRDLADKLVGSLPTRRIIVWC